jgi:signal peptidase I
MNEPVNAQDLPVEQSCATDEAVNAVISPEETASEAESTAPEAPKVPEKRRAKARGDWMSGIQWLCSTLVLAIFVITFLAQAFQIPSGSMEKTLLIGDYVLVDKVHYGGGGIWDWVMPYSDVHRGDIIVFRYPVHPTEHFVKRVIGLPGDRIHLFHKRVFVNDRALDDSGFAIHRNHDFDSYRDNFPSGNYISPDVNSTWWLQLQKIVHEGEITVPPGQYFVLGDNRDDSADSRYWGFVPRENVIGRPLLIYWSVQRPDTTAADDKLERLLYTLIHLPEDARWDRTFHLVR